MYKDLEKDLLVENSRMNDFTIGITLWDMDKAHNS